MLYRLAIALGSVLSLLALTASVAASQAATSAVPAPTVTLLP